jgi:hypothetical protein
MNTQAQAAMYLIGLVLLVAGAMTLGQEISGVEPAQYLVPCILLMSGAGAFGLGLFWPTSVLPPTDCAAPDDHEGAAGDGAGGYGGGE